ncbi:hypothetical protein FRC08_007702 [Ceratobasidium sp. 394]|nr:hypothetical protein FRC08_007702 [Ceratobasidium sp. 394]
MVCYGLWQLALDLNIVSPCTTQAMSIASRFAWLRDDEDDPTPTPSVTYVRPTDEFWNCGNFLIRNPGTMAQVEPGTYRITNVASGTSIVSYDEGAVCWQREDCESQHWVVHRVGQGYQFENSGTGWYLCLGYTDVGAQLHYSRYPTTWELSQSPEDHNTYMIQYPGTDRIVELDGRGAKGNATKLLIQSEDGWKSHRRWRFEHLSDDTGIMDGVARIQISPEADKITALDKQLAEKTKALSRAETKLKEKDKKVAEQSIGLAEKDRQLVQMAQDIDRLGKHLVRTSALLAQTQDALYRANESIATRDSQISRMQGLSKFESLEFETA